MVEVTNIMSEAVAEGYRIKPNAKNKSKMFQAAAQIERLGERNKAHVIRSFTNKWDIYCDNVIDLGGGGAVIYNGVDQRASREELHQLADKILGKRL